jgi:septum site-determining protein MinC
MRERESVVTSAEKSRQRMRFICRSYTAIVLVPKPPIFEWVADVDQKIKEAAGFFAGSPVVLDLSGVTLSTSAVAHLVAELGRRGVRIMGIENGDALQSGADMPPALRSSRASGGEIGAAEPRAREARREPAVLLLDEPVRSGQMVVFPEGDLTVLGSVASGAELIAGGSIHVYGALRGRAMAGAHGNASARIFCSKVEAELLAIDGHYLIAEMMEQQLRNRPVQVWLEGDALKISALD